MDAILKKTMANYVSLERLINIDFGKKYEFPEKKIAHNRENDCVSFN